MIPILLIGFLFLLNIAAGIFAARYRRPSVMFLVPCFLGVAMFSYLVSEGTPYLGLGITVITMMGITSFMIIVAGITHMLCSLTAPKPRRFPTCPVCAYNLTGNVSGRCPECGEPINAQSQTQP